MLRGDGTDIPGVAAVEQYLYKVWQTQIQEGTVRVVRTGSDAHTHAHPCERKKPCEALASAS